MLLRQVWHWQNLLTVIFGDIVMHYENILQRAIRLIFSSQSGTQ